jgi:hypothetical protein
MIYRRFNNQDRASTRAVAERRRKVEGGWQA